MVRAATTHLLRVDGGLRVKHVAPLLGHSGPTVCDFSRNARLDLQNGGAIAALIEQARRVLEPAPRNGPSVPPAAARLPGRRPGPPPTPSALPVPHLGPCRVRTGLSQLQLAQRSSMARETISRLENGRPARRHVILRLADALALAPSELTGHTELDALTGETYKRCKGCGALRPLPSFVQVKGARYFYPRCRTCRQSAPGSDTTQTQSSARARSAACSGTVSNTNKPWRSLGVPGIPEWLLKSSRPCSRLWTSAIERPT